MFMHKKLSMLCKSNEMECDIVNKTEGRKMEIERKSEKNEAM